MITFIQNILQKHHKYVFSVLLVVIIIAFVFTIGKGLPDFTSSYGGSSKAEKFYGYDLTRPDVASRIVMYVRCEFFLEGQQVRNEQIEALVMRQVIALHLAKEWNLRQVNEAEMADFIQTRPAFADDKGKFDPAKWENFVNSTVSSKNMRQDELDEILAVNALTWKVMKLLEGPGYVMKADIEDRFKKRAGSWDISLISLSYADFNPEIKVDDAALETYFKANIENYRIADSVTMSIAKFPAADAKDADVKDEDLLAFYTANMRNYIKVDAGAQKLSPFEEVKAQVKKDYLKKESAKAAHLKADAIVTQIYDSSAKFGSDSVAKILSANKVTLAKLPPVRATDVVLPEGYPTSVITAGVKLDKENFYSDAILADDGAYIVFFDSKEPSHLPAFAEVKDKVLQDYREMEKGKLFAARGETLSKGLKADAKDAESFAKIAADAGAKAEQLKAFSIAKPDTSNMALMQAYYVLAQNLPKMDVGEVSAMHTSRGLGYIFRVNAAVEGKLDANSPEYKGMMENSAKMFGNISAQSVMTEMMTAK